MNGTCNGQCPKCKAKAKRLNARRRKARSWNTANKVKLAKFVRDNPGLTASMIAILWRRPYGTISAVLHGMSVSGEISRRQETGMRGGVVKSWRYYDNVLGAVDDVMERV